MSVGWKQNRSVCVKQIENSDTVRPDNQVRRHEKSCTGDWVILTQIFYDWKHLFGYQPFRSQRHVRFVAFFVSSYRFFRGGRNFLHFLQSTTGKQGESCRRRKHLFVNGKKSGASFQRLSRVVTLSEKESLFVDGPQVLRGLLDYTSGWL